MVSDSAEGGQVWEDMIHAHIKKHFPKMKQNTTEPDIVIVMGGDGTIIRAISEFRSQRTVYLGLNFGTLGFLASIHNKEDFLTRITQVLSGEYSISKRIALSAFVERKGEVIDTFFAVNDISIQSLLNNVKLDVYINGYMMQSINGVGVLISSPTGSTGTNLSIDGPVVKPDLRCIIVSEVMDHDLPTPSIIVGEQEEIIVKVKDFRKKEVLVLDETDEFVDVVMRADSRNVISLKKGDKIVVTRYKYLIDIVEVEDNYFYKSLQKHFGYE